MSTATGSMRALLAAATLTLAFGAAAQDDSSSGLESSRPAGRHEHDGYSNKVLVSSGAVAASNTDPNLRNGWGVAFNPTGFVWVSSAGKGKATLYDGNGVPQSLVVTIPGVGGEQSEPTGIVFTGGMDFVVTNGTNTGPARFIFVTTGGTIAAWAPTVDALNAITVVPPKNAAIYTGLALSGNGKTHLLYAANFHDRRVDVFDGAFKPTSVPGGFVDRHLPPRYAPFGIQAINGDIYVTYAKQADNLADEVQGPGLGFVNVFDPEGHLLRRVASRGVLNAPWGLALAPASFGRFGGAVLVGNLGDGTINAFGPRSGVFLGTLRDTHGRRIHADGLWGMAFGNGINAQPANALFYAAGPNDEKDGAYGVITAVDDDD